MQRWTASPNAIVLALAALLGCQGGQADDRLQRLEERVSALEADGDPQPAAAAREPVSADLVSLERRLAALEGRLAAVEKGTPASPPGGVVETRLEQRRQRRARLRELTDEYRARLADIRQNETDPTARQQAVRDALQWYREQRRAVLAGTDPAGQ